MTRVLGAPVGSFLFGHNLVVKVVLDVPRPRFSECAPPCTSVGGPIHWCCSSQFAVLTSASSVVRRYPSAA